jgi:hypothetical protein
MQIQGHWPVAATYGHQVEHTLGVEVFFADPQRFNCDVAEGMVRSLKLSVRQLNGWKRWVNLL